jgi:hypothetical protein
MGVSFRHLHRLHNALDLLDMWPFMERQSLRL